MTQSQGGLIATLTAISEGKMTALIIAAAFVCGALAGRLMKSESSTMLERLMANHDTRLITLTYIYLFVGLTAAGFLVWLLIAKQVTDAGISAMIGAVVGQIISATLNTPSGFHYGSSEGSRRQKESAKE